MTYATARFEKGVATRKENLLRNARAEERLRSVVTEQEEARRKAELADDLADSFVRRIAGGPDDKDGKKGG